MMEINLKTQAYSGEQANILEEYSTNHQLVLGLFGLGLTTHPHLSAEVMKG